MIVSFTPVRETANVLTRHLDALRGQPELGTRWLWNDGIPTEVDTTGFLVIGHDEGGRRNGHRWTPDAVNRVAAAKNEAIDTAVMLNADFLFLIDSDVIIQPGTIAHLAAIDAPVVAAVYWTKWRPNLPWLPQVWDTPPTRYHTPENLIRLRDPGHYEVGGLGACTLIRRDVLEAGVRFTRTEGHNHKGEDRWFCKRATAAGFPLLACTHITPLHLYRPGPDPRVVLDRKWERQARAHLGS